MTCHNCRIECKGRGKDRKGHQRYHRRQCCKFFQEPQEKPLEGMYTPLGGLVVGALLARLRLRRTHLAHYPLAGDMLALPSLLHPVFLAHDLARPGVPGGAPVLGRHDLVQPIELADAL